MDTPNVYIFWQYICTGTFTPACDIWSIGCVMMEMGTGDPPWPSGPSLEAVAYMVVILLIVLTL